MAAEQWTWLSKPQIQKCSSPSATRAVTGLLRQEEPCLRSSRSLMLAAQ